MGLLVVVAHTSAIFAFLGIAIRLIARRSLAQLDVVDLVVILLLGSAVETAMVAGDVSLGAGIASVSTLIVLDGALSQSAVRSRRLSQMLGGKPILLVHDGRLLSAHLRRAGLTRDDLDEALRERGEKSIGGLRQVVLEADGTVHVVPRRQPT
ncbi:MAG: DUF421 domain-containing protein [Acidimicrobiia bacterium]|nr:DUF421 domain-containing protein [Acidimicrobiia bacterium]